MYFAPANGSRRSSMSSHSLLASLSCDPNLVNWQWVNDVTVCNCYQTCSDQRHLLFLFVYVTTSYMRGTYCSLVTALPSIFNAVILVSVLSIGNSATFATSRTLTALAGYGYALRFLMYADHEGRPLVSLFIVLVFGCPAYIDLSTSSTTIFN